MKQESISKLTRKKKKKVKIEKELRSGN